MKENAIFCTVTTVQNKYYLHFLIIGWPPAKTARYRKYSQNLISSLFFHCREECVKKPPKKELKEVSHKIFKFTF